MWVYRYWKVGVFFVIYIFYLILFYGFGLHAENIKDNLQQNIFIPLIITFTSFVFAFFLNTSNGVFRNVIESTYRTFTKITRLSMEISKTRNKHKTYEDIKTQIINLPNEIFKYLTVEEQHTIQSHIFYNYYYITVQNTYTDEFNNFILQLSLKISSYSVTNKKEISDQFNEVLDEVDRVFSMHKVQQPVYVYQILLVLAIIIQLIIVPYSLATSGFIYGTIYIIIVDVVLLFFIDGIRTIYPVFAKDSQGYKQIKYYIDHELTTDIEKILCLPPPMKKIGQKKE